MIQILSAFRNKADTSFNLRDVHSEGALVGVGIGGIPATENRIQKNDAPIIFCSVLYCGYLLHAAPGLRTGD
jgi:hypothetical protein